MASLELMVPPPFVALGFAGLMWILAKLFGAATVPLAHRTTIVIALAAIGVLFGFSAMGMFRRAQTTVNPMKPETTSALVTNGVYRITRNPMYVSLVLYLAAWSVRLSNMVALLLLPLFVLYITRFQIMPEERALTELYGPEY